MNHAPVNMAMSEEKNTFSLSGFGNFAAVLCRSSGVYADFVDRAHVEAH